MTHRPSFAVVCLGLSLVGAVAGAFTMPAAAQSAVTSPVASVKDILGNASDSALDKLSKPGAFSADSAIKIQLPGQGMMSLADKVGLTNDLTGSVNRAAEQAASEAKPIFRSAIDRVSMKDAMGVATGGNTAATDYLKRSSGSEIIAKLAPLVKAALSRTGVLGQSSQLGSVGMTDTRMIDFVTKKTSDGIFTYMGREETKARENPLGTGKAVLKGLNF